MNIKYAILIVSIVLLVGIGIVSASDNNTFQKNSLSQDPADNTITSSNTPTETSKYIYTNSKGNRTSNGKNISNPTSLSNALRHVENNGTIYLVSNGDEDTYNNIHLGNGNDLIINNNVNFTIEAMGGKRIIFNGNDSTFIQVPLESSIILKNIEIKNYSNVIKNNGNLYLENVSIHDNTGEYLIEDNSVECNTSLIISNSMISNNNLSSSLIKNTNNNLDNVKIINSTLSYNNASYIFNNTGNSVLSNNKIIGNLFNHNFYSNYKTLNLTNNTLINNTSNYKYVNNKGQINFYKNYFLNNFVAAEETLPKYSKQTKLDTKIDFNLPSTLQSGEILKFNVIVTSEDKNKVDQGELSVTIHISNKTFNLYGYPSNGKDYLEFIIPKEVSGEMTVDVLYHDDAFNGEYFPISSRGNNYVYELMYKNSHLNKTIMIKKPLADIQLSLSDTTIKMGQKIELKAKLLCNESVKGKLIFKINGRTLTDENGSALYFRVKNNTVTYNFTYDKVLYPDNYTFTAIFGNGKYKRLYDTKNFTLLKTQIKLITDKITVSDEGQVKVTGKIIDEFGNKVMTREILTIQVNDKDLRSPNYSINSYEVPNGTVNFIFDLPEKLLQGHYNVTFNVIEKYAYMNYTHNANITFASGIYMKMEAPNTVKNNTTFEVKVKVTNNNIPENKGVVFYQVDGEHVDVVAVKNGTATKKIHLDDSNNIKQHKIMATYKISRGYWNFKDVTTASKTIKLT